MYTKRFVEKMLPKINMSMYCTCGPVQGLAALAEAREDAQLAIIALKLAEKDIDLFQVPPKETSAPAAIPDMLAHVPDIEKFAGAFLRGKDQLQQEGRPGVYRIDDTTTCLLATAAALRLVQTMQTVENDRNQETVETDKHQETVDTGENQEL